MLFNSFAYLLFFLPISVIIYFWLNRRHLTIAANVWLTAASLFYYSYWNFKYFPLILSSIFVNYALGRALTSLHENGASSVPEESERIPLLTLAGGLFFNIGLLIFFKYTDFVIETVNSVAKTAFALPHIVLPLAISFFTFQQIAYLVDSYRGRTKEHDFINYALFVTYFPQLIAGPIVHHSEMMPQFKKLRSKLLNWRNIYVGLFLIGFGLVKKLGVADTFAVWVNEGFSHPEQLSALEAWRASLCYTVQIYFDFSGYMDIALGSAKLFNIDLPLNFNSPYRSLDIQDFWRRWHITLGRFLRDYIYIPLGGNKGVSAETLRNLFLTFLIGGIWHGAGWTFAAWGAIHGFGICIHHVWKKSGCYLPKFPAWLVTFLFVNSAWVFFRAYSLSDAVVVLKKMAMLRPSDFDALLTSNASLLTFPHLWIFFLSALIVFEALVMNSHRIAARIRMPNLFWSASSVASFAIVTILLMNRQRFVEFIYFRF